MSWNQENIIWQSADGTWSRGFYVGTPYGDPSNPDHDEEWDVEWDFERFASVSTGHPTQESAAASWRGANPGGHSLMHYSKDNADDAARLDLMALWLRDPAAAAKIAERHEHAAAARAYADLGLGEGSRIEVVVVAVRKGERLRDRHTGVLVRDSVGALALVGRGGAEGVVVVDPSGVVSPLVVGVSKPEPARSATGAFASGYRWFR